MNNDSLQHQLSNTSMYTLTHYQQSHSTHFKTAISCTVMALLSLVPMYENTLGLTLKTDKK